MLFTTAFAKPPTPEPPNISIIGGPHLRTLVSHSPTKAATVAASPSVLLNILGRFEGSSPPPIALLIFDMNPRALVKSSRSDCEGPNLLSNLLGSGHLNS